MTHAMNKLCVMEIMFLDIISGGSNYLKFKP